MARVTIELRDCANEEVLINFLVFPDGATEPTLSMNVASRISSFLQKKLKSKVVLVGKIQKEKP